MERKVFCIIVTYNAIKWIDKCLTSLRESSVSICPVIIDNCSDDNTISYIKENYPECHVIENKVNKGFGQANNQGIEYAYGKGASHFFLLNQDAWIYSDTVKKLVEIMDRYHFAVVSPIQLNGQGTMYDAGFANEAIFNWKNIDFISDLTLGALKEFYPVTSVPAASWLISKDTIESIGGFDPLFFHYGEDYNYCLRLMFHKLTIAIVPKAFIHHDRIFKGNVDVYNKMAILRSLYLEYSNINKRPFFMNTNTFKLYYCIVMNILKGLLTLNGKLLNNTCWTIKTFCSHIQDIKRSRRINIIKQACWLNLKK